MGWVLVMKSTKQKLKVKVKLCREECGGLRRRRESKTKEKGSDRRKFNDKRIREQGCMMLDPMSWYGCMARANGMEASE